MEDRMKIQDVQFTVTDWNIIPVTEHNAASGTSFWKTFEIGNIRVRRVDYSPGFYSDHYCTRGHVLFVIEGELIVKLKDGSEYTLSEGMSFQVSDDESNPHLAYSKTGAKVFIVD